MLVGLLWPHPARALRPFDSTDAETAEPRTWELEIGLAELRHGEKISVASPHLVANLGLASGLELVVESSQVVFFSDSISGTAARTDRCGHVCLQGTEISLKSVLVPGSLQHEGPWPSLAVETGIFLPIGGQPSGAQVAVIASERLPWFTLHANAALIIQQNQTSSTELGLVAEGPDAWGIRPVAEMTVSYDKVEDRAVSFLAGTIWDIRPNLSLDFAGVVETKSLAYQVRFGLTWTITMPHRQAENKKNFP